MSEQKKVVAPAKLRSTSRSTPRKTAEQSVPVAVAEVPVVIVEAPAVLDAAVPVAATPVAEPVVSLEDAAPAASLPAEEVPAKVPGKPAKGGKNAKSGKSEKADKASKPVKTRLVRDSYAMPESEYRQIGELKKRAQALGGEIKKSELLRAGLAMLSALNDDELKAVLARVDRIKTGRPAKK